MLAATSGTQNAVQTALQVSAATVATAIGTGAPLNPANYPVAFEHGALEGNWPDPSLLYGMSQAWSQANYTYRI